MIALCLLMLLLAGCQRFTQSGPFDLRAENYALDQERLNALRTSFTHPLTLEDAIRFALDHNLEAAVAMLEEGIKLESLTGAKRKMLPSLIFGTERSRRQNHDASKSQSIGTSGTESGDFSYSSERSKFNYNTAMTWNLLDFGISFFRARQVGSEVIKASQRIRRVRQDLVLQITEAFWRAQAARISGSDAEALLKKIADRRATLAKQLDEGTVNKGETLRVETRLMETHIRLQRYARDRDAAMTQLAAQMGLPVGVRLELASVELAKALPKLDLNMPAIEATALQCRPELFETDQDERIASAEARVAMISMFPNAALFARYDNDLDRFLLSNDWYTVGLNASLDLLSIPQKLARRRAALLQKDLAAERRLMLAVGIIAQTHLAAIELVGSRQDYRDQQALLSKRRELLANTRNEFKRGEKDAEDVGDGEIDVFMGQVRMLSAYTRSKISEARLLNTQGLDYRNPVPTQNDAVTNARSAVSWSQDERRRLEAATRQASEGGPVQVLAPDVASEADSIAAVGARVLAQLDGVEPTREDLARFDRVRPIAQPAGPHRAATPEASTIATATAIRTSVSPSRPDLPDARLLAAARLPAGIPVPGGRQRLSTQTVSIDPDTDMERPRQPARRHDDPAALGQTSGKVLRAPATPSHTAPAPLAPAGLKRVVTETMIRPAAVRARVADRPSVAKALVARPRVAEPRAGALSRLSDGLAAVRATRSHHVATTLSVPAPATSLNSMTRTAPTGLAHAANGLPTTIAEAPADRPRTFRPHQTPALLIPVVEEKAPVVAAAIAPPVKVVLAATAATPTALPAPSRPFAAGIPVPGGQARVSAQLHRLDAPLPTLPKAAPIGLAPVREDEVVRAHPLVPTIAHTPREVDPVAPEALQATREPMMAPAVADASRDSIASALPTMDSAAAPFRRSVAASSAPSSVLRAPAQRPALVTFTGRQEVEATPSPRLAPVRRVADKHLPFARNALPTIVEAADPEPAAAPAVIVQTIDAEPVIAHEASFQAIRTAPTLVVEGVEPAPEAIAEGVELAPKATATMAAAEAVPEVLKRPALRAVAAPVRVLAPTTVPVMAVSAVPLPGGLTRLSSNAFVSQQGRPEPVVERPVERPAPMVVESAAHPVISRPKGGVPVPGAAPQLTRDAYRSSDDQL